MCVCVCVYLSMLLLPFLEIYSRSAICVYYCSQTPLGASFIESQSVSANQNVKEKVHRQQQHQHQQQQPTVWQIAIEKKQNKTTSNFFIHSFFLSSLH